MIPLASMFQHKSLRYCYAEPILKSYYDNVVFNSLDAQKVGQQLFTSIGELTNIDLLLDYGFIENNNPYDSVYFNIDLDVTDPLINLKRRILADSDLKLSALFHADFVSSETIGIMRLVMCRDESLLNNTKSLKFLLKGEGIIDVDLELEVFVYLYEICKNLQAQFPTKLEEDESRLKLYSKTLSTTSKKVLEYRILERKILRSATKILIKKSKKLDSLSRICWDHLNRRTTSLLNWSLQKIENEHRDLL